MKFLLATLALASGTAFAAPIPSQCASPWRPAGASTEALPSVPIPSTGGGGLGNPAPGSSGSGAGSAGSVGVPTGPQGGPVSPSGGPSSVASAGSIASSDLTNWSYWWYFNREGLLDLDRRFNEVGPLTGGATEEPQSARPNEKILRAIVLPALFEMIAEEQQDSVRLSSGFALARIAQPSGGRVLNELRQLMMARSPALREGASLAMGVSSDPSAIGELSTVLAGGKLAKKLLGFKPNDRMRAFAAYGLAMVADRAANDDIRRMVLGPVLTRFMDTKENADLRVALISALGMMRIDFGPKQAASPELAKGQAAAQPRYRRELIEFLFQAYDNERESIVRAHFPTALARLLKGAPKDTREAGILRLLAVLDSKPSSLERHGVLSSLGIVGEAWGQPVDQKLRAVLYAQAAKQRESHARHLALMALAEVVTNSGPSLAPAKVQSEFESFLLAQIETGRRGDLAWISMAAGSFGARLRKPFIGRSGNPNRGRVGAELAAAITESLRTASSPDTLSASVLALGLIQDDSAISEVEGLLDRTSNREVRGYAALSLGLLGHKPAFGKLAILIDDLGAEPIPLEHTAMGLALLDRARGSALLREHLARGNENSFVPPLAAAIGRVSDAASVLPLTSLVLEKKRSIATREFACIALGLIADRHRLSWRSRLAEGVNYFAWTPTLFDDSGQGVLNIF